MLFPASLSELCFSNGLGHFSFPPPSIPFQLYLHPPVFRFRGGVYGSFQASWISRSQPCASPQRWFRTTNSYSPDWGSPSPPASCSCTCAHGSHASEVRPHGNENAWRLEEFGKRCVFQPPTLYGEVVGGPAGKNLQSFMQLFPKLFDFLSKTDQRGSQGMGHDLNK